MIAVLGTVLAAVYVLWVYQRVFTGQPTDAVNSRSPVIWVVARSS